MQNAEQLDNAYTTLSNSAGSSAKEQEAYMDSLEGKINALKESFVGLSIQMTNSDMLKGFVDGLTSSVGAVGNLIDIFGAFPSVITTVAGAMTLLNSKFRENSSIQMGLMIPGYSKITTALKGFETALSSSRASQIKNIDTSRILASGMQGGAVSTAGFGFELLKMQGKLALTTAGLIATKVATLALQTALSMGIGLAIGAVITGFTKLVDSMITTKKEWKEIASEATTNINKNNELVSSVEKLISKEEELNNKIKNGNSTTEEQKQARADLLEVQKQIAELLPESATGFDSEGNKISENTEKVLENLDAKKKLSEAEAIKMIGSVSVYDSDKASKQYETEKQRYEDLMNAYKNGEQYKGVDVTEKMIEKSKKKVEAYKEDIEANMKIIETLRASGWTDEQIVDKLYSTTTQEDGLSIMKKVEDAYKSMTDTINENTNAKKKNSGTDSSGSKADDVDTSDSQSSVSALESVYKSLGYTVSEASDRIKELNGLSSEDQSAEVVKDTTKAYANSISKIEELQGLIDDIGENGKMTSSIISSVASQYPEIGSAILDTGSTIDFLNGKINEQKEIYSNAVQSMMTDNAEWYANNVANNQAFQEDINAMYDKFTKNGASAYNIDVRNYKTLTELKNAMNGDLIDGMAQYLQSLVGGSAETYARDLRKQNATLYSNVYRIIA